MSTQTTTIAAPATSASTSRALARAYYQLMKPGIVYSNVMTAVAGYLFASRWHLHLIGLLELVLGTGLIIAASCVLNNMIDREIDRHMQRTQGRALVTGIVSLPAAAVFAGVLGLPGLVLLAQTNWLTVDVGIIAVISYVVLYGIAKRRSVHGTLVGTIPGAASLVAGYTAVANQLNFTALSLFLIMVTWQMAHFYAISIFRRNDYASANIPVRAVVRGPDNARRHILAYIVLYAAVTPLLYVAGSAGLIYAIGMLALSLWWLLTALRTPSTDIVRWARKTFGTSLVVLLGFSALLALGSLLP